jgi:hypothetical protein
LAGAIDANEIAAAEQSARDVRARLADFGARWLNGKAGVVDALKAIAAIGGELAGWRNTAGFVLGDTKLRTDAKSGFVAERTGTAFELGINAGITRRKTDDRRASRGDTGANRRQTARDHSKHTPPWHASRYQTRELIEPLPVHPVPFTLRLSKMTRLDGILSQTKSGVK